MRHWKVLVVCFCGLSGLVFAVMQESRLDVVTEKKTGGDVELVRGPYLQLGTSSSIVLRWRTDLETDSRVEFGLSPGNLTSVVHDPNLTEDHIVTLDSLDPETVYYYSIGSSALTLAGDDGDHYFATAPSPGADRAVRVWVLGDSGLGNDSAREVRDSFLEYSPDSDADVWLMLGDNAYVSGTDLDHQRAIFDMYPSILRTTVLWPTLGNHDGFSADSDTETGPYYDIFSLPRNGEMGGVPSGTEAYYSFDFANIHFVCLDSYDTDRSLDGAMMTWLKADLAMADQDWIIAYWHYPPYSDGHNSDTDPIMIQMRENALPILESVGVDLVLSGHSHSYERSFFLNGHYDVSSTLDPTMILDSGDGREDGDGAYRKLSVGLAPNEGTVYAVPASSSQVTPGVRDHPAMFSSLLELGSMVIDVEGNRLDAVFLDNKGEVADSFTIIKGSTLCNADFNGDGTLNFFDISEFLKEFTANEPNADINSDGLWNFFDVSQFLKSYRAGCP
ncbi:MAG: metallophosphoesterase family protein [Phycisphaerales bacterium]|nr:metallophosphoesterase family protein [Phycisphaerales bacterium]